MAHYALLDENNVVINVLTGKDETELIDGKNPETWYGEFWKTKCKRTSYNTKGNQHLLGGTPFRKNYAVIGGIYDEQNDAFYSQKPFNSWVLNQNTFLWEPPVPYPVDPDTTTEPPYFWSEEQLNWIQLNLD